jgi:tetratricopeptide (TPR) repeat protein
LIKKALHRWHAKKSNFAKALIYSKKIGTEKKHAWYYYRLCMYKTVSSLELVKPFLVKDLFAKIISLAACGKYKEARKFLKLFLEHNNASKYKSDLADALAPYLPGDAFDLLDKDTAPSTLYLALLLKVGKIEEAQKFSNELINSKLVVDFPELYLYRSNVFVDLSSSKKIELMNSFLAHYSLGRMQLQDRAKAMSTENIELQSSFEVFNGPLVSVLMTTYKTGSRLNTAIASVLSQTYQNLELYIVDDASSDDTAEIIQEWVNKDSRVKYIQLKHNVGTYVAKNLALLQCSGEFVTCHDSDDYSHPLKLQMQIKPLLKNKKLVATISSWVRLDDEGFYYARPVHPLMRINPSSLLFRKEKILKSAGIWDCVRTGADSEFMARLRLVFGKKRVKKIAKPLSFGAHRADSLMNASSTGYCEFGMSPQRLEYWESWNKWHIDTLAAKSKPMIATNMLAKRVFEAPESIVVSKESIKKVLMNE